MAHRPVPKEPGRALPARVPVGLAPSDEAPEQDPSELDPSEQDPSEQELSEQELSGVEGKPPQLDPQARALLALPMPMLTGHCERGWQLAHSSRSRTVRQQQSPEQELAPEQERQPEQVLSEQGGPIPSEFPRTPTVRLWFACGPSSACGRTASACPLTAPDLPIGTLEMAARRSQEP